MRTIRTLAFLLAASAAATGQGKGVLNVCATVPDLGQLVSEIGGTEVSVTVFAKGTEDPHFIDAKPSFIKALASADVLVVTGMDLEVGWIPAILANSRNAKVQVGTSGYIDASTVIKPLEVPTGTIDRSMGDVHPAGNPHFLLDPLNGLKVAGLIRDKLGALRPDARKTFEERYKAFRQKIGDALVGPELAKKYDFEKLALLHEHGKLGSFLEERKEKELLGGWLKAMLPYYGAKAVGEHNLYPYFAQRFGLVMVGFFEPLPGVPPTTKHLAELIKTMTSSGVKLILNTPYYDRKHADFVAAQTGAKIAAIAHQVGAHPGAKDYVGTVDHNVRELVKALGGS
jgi:ABC-type Zn uptake system ZnuABC Zn-binding protein ZnuA